MTQSQDDYMTTGEIARALGVTAPTVRRMVENGEFIQPFRPRVHARFPRDKAMRKIAQIKAARSARQAQRQAVQPMHAAS